MEGTAGAKCSIASTCIRVLYAFPTEAQSCSCQFWDQSGILLHAQYATNPDSSSWPVGSRGSKVSGRLVTMMHNPTNVMYVHAYSACTVYMYGNTYNVFLVRLLKDTPPYYTTVYTHTGTCITTYMYSVFS